MVNWLLCLLQLFLIRMFSGPIFARAGSENCVSRRDIKIAVITHGGRSDGTFWNVFEDGVLRAGRDTMLYTDYLTPDSGNDYGAMEDLVAYVLQEGYNGAVITISTESLWDDVAKMVNARILVMSTNAGYDDCARLGCLAHVGQEEYSAGFGSGEKLIRDNPAATHAICLNVAPGSEGVDLRCEGFIASLEGAGLTAWEVGLTVSDITGNAITITDALENNPEVTILLCSGTPAWTGAQQALTTLGRTDVAVGLFDYSPPIPDFAVDQQQYIQGYFSVMYMGLMLSTGARLNSGLWMTGPGFVEAEDEARKQCENTGVAYCGDEEECADPPYGFQTTRTSQKSDPDLCEWMRNSSPSSCPCIDRAALDVWAVTDAKDGDPFWVAVRQGFAQGAADAHVGITLRNPLGRNELETLRHLDEAIAAPAAVLVASAPSEAIASKLRAAAASGIPVVTVGSGYSLETAANTHVGMDDFAAGRSAGYLMAALGAREVMCVKPLLGIVSLEERCDGLREGLDLVLGLDVGVVHELVLSSDNPSLSISSLLNLLNDPSLSIDGILSLGLEASPVVVAAAGATSGGTDAYVMAAFDIDETVATELEVGTFRFALDAQPYAQGYIALLVAAQTVSSGNQLANPLLDVGPRVVAGAGAALRLLELALVPVVEVNATASSGAGVQLVVEGSDGSDLASTTQLQLTFEVDEQILEFKRQETRGGFAVCVLLAPDEDERSFVTSLNIGMTLIILAAVIVPLFLCGFHLRRRTLTKVRALELLVELSEHQKEVILRVMERLDGNTEEDDLFSVHISAKDVELIAKLGIGAFGEVWKGKYHGEPCAIKRMLPERIDELTMEQFKAEIKLLRSVRHPNIIGFLGASWEPPNIMLLLELAIGGALTDRLRPSEALPRLTWLEHKLRIALGVAQGMAYLHSLKPPVLHRDIKSLNILLTEDLEAKVADFGTSREMSDATMTSVGTKLWLAPEVFLGVHYGPPCDVYSFGMVLCEMVLTSGKLQEMFTGQANPSLVIAQGWRPDFSDFRTDLNEGPSGLSGLITACWEGKPELRPTFPEIVERLHTMQASMARGETASNTLGVLPARTQRNHTSSFLSGGAADTNKKGGGLSGGKEAMRDSQSTMFIRQSMRQGAVPLSCAEIARLLQVHKASCVGECGAFTTNVAAAEEEQHLLVVEDTVSPC